MSTEYVCSICGQPVSLSDDKTDDYGQPVHEDCYLKKLVAADESKLQLLAS